MKFLGFLFAFMLAACTVSQYTMYKPAGEQEGWNIKVEQSGSTFTLFINDQSVIEKSYAFLGTQFEAESTYKGKQVKMFGYRSTSTGYKGEISTHDQVRVIIDGSEVSKFDF
jgi:hypothetical protein